MGQVLVHILSDDLIANLKAQAKASHRSFEGEIRCTLTNAIDRRTRIEQFRELAKRVMDSTADTQLTDSVDLIREDRDR